ncbi:MAG TPA: cytochrome C [Gammaproteobacteria bacterium]|nr:cytochrome C [Gammaproteobacteria bacterium]
MNKPGGRRGPRRSGRVFGLLLLAVVPLLCVPGIASAAAATAATPAGASALPAGHPLTKQACESCHAPRRVPTVDPGVLAHSVHAKLNCTDCHSDINAIPHARRLEPVDCGGCHRRVLHQLRMGEHASGKAAGKRTPDCTDCHGAHDVQKVDSAAFRNSIPQRCAACHKEHYKGYMDRFHGQAAALGMAKAPRCSDCHDPHRPLPASDPHSSVAPGNLVATCGQCHKNINANFTRFDPHPQPGNPAHSAVVFYSHIVMVALLIFVFGFFGLHTVLWLQRGFVARLRGELPRVQAEGNAYVQRFSTLQRWMHVTVIVSFILLAMTGLPLKYASAPWAHFLSQLLGGEPQMRDIHLVCAGITFGYFFLHLVVVAWRFVRTRDFGLFWGANSMVPRGKDLVDLYQNVRWFLYLGPRPRLDRWTYWEKFDYWAVFWGVAMIGASGLMLAIPALAARVLPGQILNVAAVVHGEEALLAVGFIFIFHYFHNHLRPENFPMDITIFTGRLPLERFREERPQQYERLVREDKLQGVLVGPPSRLAVWAWTTFGAIVVLVGLALIVSVIITVAGGA